MSTKISKCYLKHIALIELSDSNYTSDVFSLRGFAIALSLEPHELAGWLREQLGEDYPTILPENWIYGEGI